MSTYKSPTLCGHDVLHKDRQFMVFRVSYDHPYDGYESDYSILVFDRLYDAVVGFCNDHYSGHCNPGTYQDSLPISGSNAAELVISTRNCLKEFQST